MWIRESRSGPVIVIVCVFVLFSTGVCVRLKWLQACVYLRACLCDGGRTPRIRKRVGIAASNRRGMGWERDQKNANQPKVDLKKKEQQAKTIHSANNSHRKRETNKTANRKNE